ncbi:hypothetical protein Palpr_1203 [Paludibacter propionicigenes WB4]|uniref:Uncharacterized protein n=1 Tax=Paludibacter propionicigenes (strain DSM 17365 / JCM 13257 / WB4) TaxID=694427 RepID=E4T3Q6_PALPW|nr:hypothetical protein Palpr_1203 [Paludibacter propionicigenes WB4]
MYILNLIYQEIDLFISISYLNVVKFDAFKPFYKIVTYN